MATQETKHVEQPTPAENTAEVSQTTSSTEVAVPEKENKKPLKKHKKVPFSFATFLKKRENALSVFGTSSKTDWMVVLVISGIFIVYILIQGFTMYTGIVNNSELDPIRSRDSVQLNEKELRELLDFFEEKNRVLRGIGGVVETTTRGGDEDGDVEEVTGDAEVGVDADATAGAGAEN